MIKKHMSKYTSIPTNTVYVLKREVLPQEPTGSLSEGVNRLVSMIHLVDIWAWIAKRLLGRFSPSSQWIRIAREVIIFTHIHTHKGVFFLQ